MGANFGKRKKYIQFKTVQARTEWQSRWTWWGATTRNQIREKEESILADKARIRAVLIARRRSKEEDKGPGNESA